MSSHPLLVVGSVLAEAGVSLSLSRILDVGIVEKVLDAEEDLLDGNCWPPVLLLINISTIYTILDLLVYNLQGKFGPNLQSTFRV